MATRGLKAMPTEETTPTTGPTFEEKTVTVRGTTYRLRELDSSSYDKLLKQATLTGDDPDVTLLLRLMVVKSLVEPQLSGDALGELPYRVVRTLTEAVSDLHFGAETPETEQAKNA